jgi:hypothetical protein
MGKLLISVYHAADNRQPAPTKMRAQCPKLGKAREKDSIITLITTYNIYT